MATLNPDQIKLAVEYTTNLIQFSWTASALLLTAQGWLIGKLYSQNRVLQWWHWPTLISGIANVVGMLCLLSWYELIVGEALDQKSDFFKTEISCRRDLYYWSIIFAVILFSVGFGLWAAFKAKQNPSTTGVQT